MRGLPQYTILYCFGCFLLNFNTFEKRKSGFLVWVQRKGKRLSHSAEEKSKREGEGMTEEEEERGRREEKGRMIDYRQN